MTFNPVQYFEFGKSRGFINNTFIGGVASTINTPALLATKLSCSESNIHNFTIAGDNIECYIDVDYDMLSNVFFSNTNITYYDDIDGKCKKLIAQCFQSAINLKRVFLPSCLSIPEEGVGGFRTFAYCLSLEIVYIPQCIVFGETLGNDNVFSNQTKQGLRIYAHPSMATINGGGVEGDLLNAINTLNATVNYVTNQTAPNAITDLAVDNVYGTYIEVSWTEPTNTNGIDFYEIYVDGVLNKTTTSLNASISGLTYLETYNIKIIAVDNFYNKSDFSNELNVLVNGVDPISVLPLANIISEYKFEDNVLDTVGANDGTPTSLTYENSLVGKAGVFNGSSSKVAISSNNNLSFGNGLTDVPFSISFLFNRNLGTQQTFIDKRKSDNTLKEYSIYYNLTELIFRIFDYSTGGYIDSYYSFTPTNNIWYHITATYNGSGLTKLYVNGVNVGSLRSSGTYIAMENNVGDLVFGMFSHSAFLFNGKEDCVRIWNKELTQTEITELATQELAGVDINP